MKKIVEARKNIDAIELRVRETQADIERARSASDGVLLLEKELIALGVERQRLLAMAFIDKQEADTGEVDRNIGEAEKVLSQSKAAAEAAVAAIPVLSSALTAAEQDLAEANERMRAETVVECEALFTAACGAYDVAVADIEAALSQMLAVAQVRRRVDGNTRLMSLADILLIALRDRGLVDSQKALTPGWLMNFAKDKTQESLQQVVAKFHKAGASV